MSYEVGTHVNVSGFGPGEIIEVREEDIRGLPYTVKLESQEVPLSFSDESFTSE